MKPGSPSRAPVRHLERLCLQTRRLRAIPRLATAAEGDLSRLLHALCAAAPTLFPDAADAACVLLDDGAGVLRVRAAAGCGPAFLERAAIAVAEAEALLAPDGPDGGVLRFARPRLAPPPALDDDSLGCGLVLPLRTRGELGGLLLVGSQRQGEVFSDDDVLYAEVLATLVGGQLAEIALGRSVMRLQRALWATAQPRPARTPSGRFAPIREDADEADEVDTLPRFRGDRKKQDEQELSGSA